MSQDRFFSGCAGRCMQGRQPCDCRDELANGCTRIAQPGELLPNPPDPAQGVDGVGWTIGLVGALLTAVLFGHALLRAFA